MAIAALVVSSANTGAAQDDTAQRCAARDVQFVLALEELGDKQTVAGEKLYAAFVTMLDARHVCFEGRLAEAMQMYDRALTSDIAQK
jgi:hypothetical protein